MDPVLMRSWRKRACTNLPKEVKADGGVFGLDQSPEPPEEVRSLVRKTSGESNVRQCKFGKNTDGRSRWSWRCGCVCVSSHQGKLVDLHVECLQLLLADLLLKVLGKELEGLHVN